MARTRTLGLGDLELLRIAGMQSTARIDRVIRKPTEFANRPFLNGASPDMNVDGSITPVEFRYTALIDTLITRIQGVILDNGIEPDLFGGQPALANGVTMHAHTADGVIIYDFLGSPITANWQFSLFSSVQTQIFIGATQDIFEFGIDLAASGTSMLIEQGQYIDFNINDDLSALTAMRIAILGYSVISVPPSFR